MRTLYVCKEGFVAGTCASSGPLPSETRLVLRGDFLTLSWIDPELPVEDRLFEDFLYESPWLTSPFDVVLKDRTLCTRPVSGMYKGSGSARYASGRLLVRGRWAARMSRFSLGLGLFLNEEDRDCGAEWGASILVPAWKKFSSSCGILCPSRRMSVKRASIFGSGDAAAKMKLLSVKVLTNSSVLFW